MSKFILLVFTSIVFNGFAFAQDNKVDSDFNSIISDPLTAINLKYDDIMAQSMKDAFEKVMLPSIEVGSKDLAVKAVSLFYSLRDLKFGSNEKVNIAKRAEIKLIELSMNKETTLESFVRCSAEYIKKYSMFSAINNSEYRIAFLSSLLHEKLASLGLVVNDLERSKADIDGSLKDKDTLNDEDASYFSKLFSAAVDSLKTK